MKVSKENKVVPNLTRYRLVFVLFIAIVTFFCYNYSLHNQFTNWDDNEYVDDNPYIKNLTSENVKMILFHNITHNYYHPITMLSLATNYHFSKMDPFGYYLTNIVFHIFNTCLMFFMILMLLEAMQKKGYGEMKSKEWLATLGALCFGLHPMHVESVSWLAERKDVLYCFFYFLGLMAYVKYTKEDKIKWMVYAVILYICSLASKPLAVVFPLSLFAIDILLKRPIGRKIFMEKSPFFLISLVGGIWAWHAQKTGGAIASLHAYSLFHRLLFVSHNFMTYFIKAFVPLNLCSLYPYPVIDANGALPVMYYLSPFIVLAIVGGGLYLSYRSGENYFRVVIFGFSFFLVNLAIILQFIPVGYAIMADRYTYIAYFGIFFMLIYFVQQLWQRVPVSHIPVQAGMGLFLCILSSSSYNRTKVWHNTETMWADVIKQYPDRDELAYNSLGSYYFGKGDFDAAFGYYQTAISMNTQDAKVYSNIGNIYAMRRQLGEAFKAYKQALKIDSNDVVTYLDIGVTYSSVGKYDSAETDYNRAYSLDPTSEKVLRARAFNYLSAGKYSMAIPDYKKLVVINPNIPFYWQQLAVTEGSIGDTVNAFINFKHCLGMEPENASCMFNLSILYRQTMQYTKALEFALKAQQYGYKLPDSYISDLQQSVNTLAK